MIHIRIDDGELNSECRFACGLGPELPEGHLYYDLGERVAYRHATCPQCREAIGWPKEPGPLGTPFSELSTKPGQPGYEHWLRIAQSWGYD